MRVILVKMIFATHFFFEIIAHKKQYVGIIENESFGFGENDPIDEIVLHAIERKASCII